MDELKKEESLDLNEEKFVHDYSVDHKGNVPLRASTGAWKASLFIITIEFSERMSYYGIATSMIIYLTKVMHQDLKTAAKSVNYWSGVTTVMPLVGGFVADAYMGRFSTVLVSSIVYLLGLLLLTMSRVIPSWKPCASSLCHKPRKVHEVIFFLAIYLISIGTGGHKPALESFGADQFDDDHPEERIKKMSFSNWWSCGLCSGILTAATLIVYVQDHLGWETADIILTCIMASTIVIFCIGRPFYRFRIPSGSPLTPMLQVFVAAITKRKLSLPSNPDQLYEVPESANNQGRLLCHTTGLRFLHKAAIIEGGQGSVDKQKNPWKLTTVTKVEETKLILKTIPIWLTSLTFASVYSLNAIGVIISVIIYDKVLVPLLKRATGNERGINILQRIGIGMTFTFATMVIAALVERKRLNLHLKDPIKGSQSMSVFWLAPQFLIIGFGDGFSLVGLQEYFYDQVPDSMRSIGIGLYLSVLGVAHFLSSFLIIIVDQVTEKRGKSWFGKDVNSSRLDYFYWLLAVITVLNFFAYVVVAQRYSYKNVQKRGGVAIADCDESDSKQAHMPSLVNFTSSC